MRSSDKYKFIISLFSYNRYDSQLKDALSNNKILDNTTTLNNNLLKL